MEKIKELVEELAAVIRERKGALVCFVNPGDGGKNLLLHSEGYVRDLAALVGTSVMSDENCREYVLRGVEAAQYLENKKKQKNDKADC